MSENAGAPGTRAAFVRYYVPHLRERRIERFLTQEQLADRAGLARDGLSRLEQGRRPALARTVQRLADALGVGVADLVGDTPPVCNPDLRRPGVGGSQAHRARRAGEDASGGEAA